MEVRGAGHRTKFPRFTSRPKACVHLFYELSNPKKSGGISIFRHLPEPPLACVWRTAEIHHHAAGLPLELEAFGHAAVVTGTRALRPVADGQAHLSWCGVMNAKSHKCRPGVNLSKIILLSTEWYNFRPSHQGRVTDRPGTTTEFGICAQKIATT